MKERGDAGHVFRFDNGGIHSILVNGTWTRIIRLSVVANQNTHVYIDKNDPRLQASLKNAEQFISYIDVTPPRADMAYPDLQGNVTILDFQNVHCVCFHYDFLKGASTMELRMARWTGPP